MDKGTKGTKGQRDKATKGQRDKGTKGQRDKGTKGLRDKGTKGQRDFETLELVNLAVKKGPKKWQPKVDTQKWRS